MLHCSRNEIAPDIVPLLSPFGERNGNVAQFKGENAVSLHQEFLRGGVQAKSQPKQLSGVIPGSAGAQEKPVAAANPKDFLLCSGFRATVRHQPRISRRRGYGKSRVYTTSSF